MYHSIADNSLDPHAIHPQAFANQMAILEQRQSRVISLTEGIRWLREWRNLTNTVVLTFDDAYRDFLVNAAPVLKQFGFHATVFAPTGLVGSSAKWDTYDKTKQLMDWDELAEAERLGFHVASHTVSHPRLTECDEVMLERELRGSWDSLREHLSQPVPILSYPGGYFGRREIRAAQRCGYIGAVGVASRWPNYQWTNPFHLRRQRWAQ
jgi:peptidoglycan/xylan/chitin deacetylase (PgdA/CDA1 family)